MRRALLYFNVIITFSLLLAMVAIPAWGAMSGDLVVGWGRDTSGQASPPSGLTDVVAIDGGTEHSLALEADGTVVAWGWDGYGQTTIPTGLVDVVAIAAGSWHSLALEADGTVVGWGRDHFGQATPPAGLTNVTAISAGLAHSVALKDDGTVVAWGAAGRIDVPVGLTDVIAVSAGGDHSLALRADGTVVAWGRDDFGQASPPPGLTDVVAVSGGFVHSLALTADGVVVAWGWNVYGQGSGGLTDVTAIAAGDYHNLAVRTDRTVAGWGWNTSGQADPPPGLDDVIIVAAGHSHSLAVVNEAPTLTVDAAVVGVEEGSVASNGGTVADPDGDVVSLSASVGTVSDEGDGTWSWVWPTSDGPADSQTVTVSGDDGNGGLAEVSFEVAVANMAPTVADVVVPAEPVAIGDQPIMVTASFSDPAGTFDEPYTCAVDHDDGAGPQAGTVAGSTCEGPEQTYAEPGVYTVSVSVTDKDGGTGTAIAQDYLVIYDLEGGFVTGGGWIDSAEGAYRPDPAVAGKASFGFVSKYKKGASVPTGNTEFQFRAAELDFHSTGYDWLVVTGNDTARFKGIGTINGAGEYEFMLWAGDDDPDTFRIKIWSEDQGGVETVVYDNGFDQALGGGNIVVHR